VTQSPIDLRFSR